MGDPTATSIRDLAEQHWNGEGDLVHAHHPVQPVLGRAAEEIAPGILTMISIASVNAIDTGDGLAMLDTGGQFDADIVYDHVRAWRPETPVRAAVYSHHHVDHVFGTKRFETEATERRWPQPVVYAHEDLPDNFRRYERTLGWNSAINKRQFAIPVDRFDWPSAYRYPDVTYRDHLTFTQGTSTFELHHARGETDDATWTFVPELGILHPGDLFIWAVPNAGNPQKVQRFASDWAAALREMAGCGAEILLCGHGLPIFGADRVRQALTDTADVLDTIEAQTLVLMNQGVPLDRVIHEVEIPERLRELPYLRPVYDHPQFLVRNVWRRYGGWYDGEPDNLLPAPRAEQAREWVTLAGGLERVLERARELAAAGDHRLACHLVEFAVLFEPGSAEAHEVRADVYAARSAQQESSMARNILGHAAHASRQGKRDLAGEYDGVSRFTSFDGTGIEYRTWNDDAPGPPVLLHHGFIADAELNWVAPGVVDALVGAGRPVVAHDARGHGRSDKPHDPAAYGEATMVRDLGALADHLGLDEFDLGGYSLGAVVSLLAATEDRRIRRLLVGGVGAGIVEAGGVDSRELRLDAVAGAMETDDPSTIADPTARLFRRFADAIGGDRMADAAHARAAHQSGIPLEQITAPTMLVVGDADALAARPEVLTDAIPHAELVVVPGNHLDACADPAFIAAVTRFLAPNPESTTT